ncbi:MAG TPA: NADH-quinone oxidoreductase subunit NuoB [Candidatus Dormibacteraeota bacterium]
MSRWVLRGLQTGIRTTPFPAYPDPDSSPTLIELSPGSLTPETALASARVCPTSAIEATGDAARGALVFDAGQCVMCGRCLQAAPDAFHLSSQPEVAVRSRERLRVRVKWLKGRIQPLSNETVKEQANGPRIKVAAEAVRKEPEAGALVQELHRRSLRIFRRSLHIRHVDAGSCNGCESELQMLSTPRYDLARLGLFFTPTPRHADCLLVTGVVTRQMEQALRKTYQAMPSPKLVLAAGVCAIGGGCFAGGFMTHGPLDEILPVDVYVPGCPPTPLALLHGLLLAVGKAEERYQAGEPSSVG